MQHEEQVVPVGVHLRHLARLPTITDGQRVKLEDFGQQTFICGIQARNIDPHEAVVALQQVGKLVGLVRLDALFRDPPDPRRALGRSTLGRVNGASRSRLSHIYRV